LKESKTHSKTQADQYQKFVMECNTRWQKLSIPTIAAINGHCFGWVRFFQLFFLLSSLLTENKKKID